MKQSRAVLSCTKLAINQSIVRQTNNELAIFIRQFMNDIIFKLNNFIVS